MVEAELERERAELSSLLEKTDLCPLYSPAARIHQDLQPWNSFVRGLSKYLPLLGCSTGNERKLVQGLNERGQSLSVSIDLSRIIEKAQIQC